MMRVSLKSLVPLWSSKKLSRTDIFIEKQKETSRGLLQKLRSYARKALESETQGCVPSKTRNQGKPRKLKVIHSRVGERICNQLVQPDFFVEVPSHLSTEWIVYKRPEGPRVILVYQKQKCQIYTKNGSLLGRYRLALPHAGCTILDCVIANHEIYQKSRGKSRNPELSKRHIGVKLVDTCDSSFRLGSKENVEKSEQEAEEETNNMAINDTIYVCDCVCWNDRLMEHTSAECRYFILHSRFTEIYETLKQNSSLNDIKLKLIDVYPATEDNLTRLYEGDDVNFFSDSLMFVHKEAFYLPGISQLYLCWRDFKISRYPVDCSREDWHMKRIPPLQCANLWLNLKDGQVYTEDRICVKKLLVESIPDMLERLDSTVYLNRWKKGIFKQKLLIRISIQGFNLGAGCGDLSTWCSTNRQREFLEEEDHYGMSDSFLTKVGENEFSLFTSMEIIGTPSPERNKADSLNRIIHQYMMRKVFINDNSPSGYNCRLNEEILTFKDLLHSAATGLPNYKMLLVNGCENIEKYVPVSELWQEKEMLDEETLDEETLDEEILDGEILDKETSEEILVGNETVKKNT